MTVLLLLPFFSFIVAKKVMATKLLSPSFFAFGCASAKNEATTLLPSPFFYFIAVKKATTIQLLSPSFSSLGFASPSIFVLL